MTQREARKIGEGRELERKRGWVIFCSQLPNITQTLQRSKQNTKSRPSILIPCLFPIFTIPHVTHSYTSSPTPAFLIPSPSVSSARLLLFSSHVTTCWSLPRLLCVWFERRRSFSCTAFGSDCIALPRCGQRSCQPLVISDSSWFSTILEGKYVPLAQHIVFSQGRSSVDATTNPKFPSTC